MILRDAALNYTGSGTSVIALARRIEHAERQLSAADSRCRSRAPCGEHATTTAAAGFTNAGTITLTNGETAANNATLGDLLGHAHQQRQDHHRSGDGGTRTIQGNITNTGTLTIKTNTIYNGAKAR